MTSFQIQDRPRVVLKTPDGEQQHGNGGYCGIMFDVTSSNDVMVRAVHAVTHSKTYRADATVFTVMGSFAEHMNNRESWTQQCSGPVTYELSRLQFSVPQVLKPGVTLGIYVTAPTMYCTGLTVHRQQPVSDELLTISSGAMLTGQFEGINQGNFSFVGGIEYTVDYCQGFNNATVLDDLSRDLFAYCMSDDMADVTLIIGDSRLAAHSLILAARSSVFRTKLHQGAAKNDNDTEEPPQEEGAANEKGKEVHIEDMEEVTMRAMLRYIYSGTLDPDMLGESDPCMALAKAARQYDLPTLVHVCTDCLAKDVDVGSVSDILLLADDLSCQTLKQHCLDFIGKHGAEVQNTEGFRRATQRHSLVLEIFAAIRQPKTSDVPEANPVKAAIGSAAAAALNMGSNFSFGKGGTGKT